MNAVYGRIAAVAGLALALAACAGSTSLSHRLVSPPPMPRLFENPDVRQQFRAMAGAHEGRTRLPGGPELAWYTLEPGHRRLDYRFTRQDAGTFGMALDFTAAWGPPPRPRGTILLLHGWGMDGDSLLPWALTLAEGGWRAIALDLRNHGASGHAPAGYGLREAGDVAALLADLRQRGELAGPLFLFGISYGAATAILTAGDASGRAPAEPIAGVVALESFDRADRAIRDMAPTMLRTLPGWRGRFARWRYGRQNLDAVIAATGRRLDLALERIDVGAALARTDACVLLIHGEADRHIPIEHARRLATAAPRVRLLEVPDEHHLSLPLRVDRLGSVVLDWLGEVADGFGDATGRNCPAPASDRSARRLGDPPE